MLRSLGAFLLAALAAGGAARADSQQARFLVSATVPERVTIEALEQPARLVISADDLQRGYKDVTARFVISQNTKRGWMLQLSPRLGITQYVQVRGLPTDLVLRDDSAEVYRPRTATREEILLDYRLVLDAGARPGTYDMPVHVTATPL